MMMRAKVVALLILLACPNNSAGFGQCSNFSNAKVALCTHLPFYARDSPPEPYPHEVKTSVVLNSVVELNDVLRTIRINMLLWVSWKDDRLSLTDHLSKDWYTPNKQETKELFFPTIEFVGAKDIKLEARYSPSPDQQYFWFQHQTREFEYQQTMKVTVYCNFDFSSFPFDSHDCNMTFRSADLSVLFLHLSVPTIHVNGQNCSTGPVMMNQRNLPFDIFVKSQEPFEAFEAGFTYSHAGIVLHLKRNDLGLLRDSFYEPTLIFNCLSLISFAIHPDAVPGRLGLLITLYLIAMNVYNSVQGPPSRGFSYIEIWMLGVHIPMLTAIFEYGFLLAIRRICPRSIKNIEKFCNHFDKNTFFLSSGFIVCFNLCYWLMTSM